MNKDSALKAYLKQIHKYKWVVMRAVKKNFKGLWATEWGRGSVLHKTVVEGFSEDLAFEQRAERCEAVSHADVY